MGLRGLLRRAGAGLRRSLSKRWWPWIAAILALLLFASALSAGWQLDDYFHRSRMLGFGAADPIQVFVPYDGNPQHNWQQMVAGTLPWWSSHDLHLAFFRYLSTLSMMLDYHLWPNQPWLMHLHSLLWLVALVLVAGLLYRRVMGSTWVAGLAVLLFALDGAHAIPASYLADRNALIACALGSLSVLLYARGRQESSLWAVASSALFLALALAAGEMGLATAGYLFAYAVALDHGSWLRRLGRLWPHGVVLGAWVVVYRVGNFGSSGSGFYSDPLHQPAAFARGLLHHVPLLLMGQWTPIPAELGLVFAPGTRAATELELFASAVVVIVVLLLFPLFRRDRVARFWGIGVLLSLVPIAAVGPEDRLLGFVGLGSMALLAQLARSAFAGSSSEFGSRFWRRFAQAGVIVLLPLRLLAAPAMGVARVEVQKKTSAAMLRAIASVPSDPKIEGQDLVLVNPPDHVYLVTAIPVVKQLQGLPAARRMRALSAGSAMEVRRAGPDSLDVRFTSPFFPTAFSRYARSAGDRFEAGQQVKLPGLSVTVEKLDRMGDPKEVLYTFQAPLDDPSLRFMRWKDGVYVPWRPPALGSTTTLAKAKGIF